MRYPLVLFAVCAALIVAAWSWLGQPVEMPPSPLSAAEKLYCVSYAPFRDNQNPLSAATRIERWQIEDDLARLARLTNCVRTYSTEHGLDQIPEIARRHGLKVLQGLWLSSHADKNNQQVESVVALAKQFPDVIQGIVVGNEVLLRGELSVDRVAAYIREVKAQVPSIPVTYADVWEFWLRFRELAPAVDFVTIHILPYWEDFPISADQAGPHVESIRKRVAAAFPGKEILIGETGWPSAGRMREGALPSPANQARVIHDILTAAKRENWRITVIEAFDQPWKRALEGTVGGHWGFLDAYSREFKFEWGAPVSNHPYWLWQAAGGVLLAGLIFAAAIAAHRWAKTPAPTLLAWSAISATAVAGGVLAGWAVANAPLESFGLGGWVRSIALAAVAIAGPVIGAVALATGTALPSFAQILGRASERIRDPLAMAAGAALIVLTLVAIQAALGLAFDPRYRDFPFAPLTAAVVPFAALALVGVRPGGRRGLAETMAAGVIVLAAVYLALNESFANWQAVWTSAALLVLAFTLLRVRDARS